MSKQTRKLGTILEPEASGYDPVDLLKKDWPGAKDQLHAGGWEITRDMSNYVEEALGINTKPIALEICCGEGATACYLASQRGWDVIGVDIDDSAIFRANLRWKQASITATGKVDFHCKSLNELQSFDSNHFDVVYGEDPDGLLPEGRFEIFRELFRVLKPNGILTFHQYNIPSFGWDKNDLETFWRSTNNNRLCADLLVQELEESGFKLIERDSIAALSKHLIISAFDVSLRNKMTDGDSQIHERLEIFTSYLKSGHDFGVRVVARKPA